MRKLVMLVGPPGSGKSTMAKSYIAQGYSYFNQDSQGKGHVQHFNTAVLAGEDVLVDRMNFDVQQRARYLDIAKQNGYHTTIIVLHESYKTCVERAIARKDHETIKDEATARKAINFFFSKYERVQDSEANDVIRIWPGGEKPMAIICDLDGTLCEIEHRRHHVRKPAGEKKDWAAFNREIPNDTLNKWCWEILHQFKATYAIVLCSGRNENTKKETVEWLNKHEINYDSLFMRNRVDSRQDNIIKEIILDFEILTNYRPYFMIDDRKQVVDMWRRRGFVTLQCAEGDF